MCTESTPCIPDFDGDGDTGSADAMKFKEDFGRSGFSNPCPTCVVGNWCSYP